MRRVVALLTMAALPCLALAAQPQFWKIEGARDFLDGDIEGLSVDSEGRVSLAPALRTLHDPEVPHVWSVVRDDKGVVYAGTGNEGRVYRIEGDKGRVLFDAPELEVQALALDPQGRLYAATSPDGKVYRIAADGTATVFFDPSDRYVWALAFDRAGRLLVATGADGRLHRVAPDGTASVLLTTPETHLTALAVGRDGTVYAGSAPGGILYRVTPDGKVFVVHDSAYREVKALDVDDAGNLYAAVIEGNEPGRAPVAMPVAAAPVVTSSGQVTVTEEITVIGSAPASPAPGATPLPPPSGRVTATKGAVLRIGTSGEVDTVWNSSEESPFSVSAASGEVLVGTGDKGKVYRVRDDRNWTMLASVQAEQITALVPTADGFVVATANPGKVHLLGRVPSTSGSFTSKPRDAEAVAGWGRLRWEGATPARTRIEISTRSGNTSTPDSTWTDWSAPATDPTGAPVGSTAARFLQVRATLTGEGGRSPELDTVTTSYLQRNLRPQVSTITVHPPGEVFQKPLSITGEVELLGLDSSEVRPANPRPAPATPLPPATTYARKMFQKGMQTFSWKADDANDDNLLYDVLYRRVGDDQFRPLRRGVDEAVLAWDTTTVPNGRYLIRVVASDAPGNPGALALAGHRDSTPFEIDNTPPTVTAQASATGVRAVVRDDSSVVRRAEYSVDGGKWMEIHPTDGISDAMEEVFEFSPATTGSGPHVVVVRAFDLLNNVSTARVDLR